MNRRTALMALASLFCAQAMGQESIIESLHNPPTGVYQFTIVQNSKLAEPPTIEWLGHVVYSKPYDGGDPGFYMNGPPPQWITNTEVEIGLRSDGVVVWRKEGK